LVDLELFSAGVRVLVNGRAKRRKREGTYFGEEGIEAVDFLSFFYVSVVLGDTP
jgi:hypothetical protein